MEQVGHTLGDAQAGASPLQSPLLTKLRVDSTAPKFNATWP